MDAGVPMLPLGTAGRAHGGAAEGGSPARRWGASPAASSPQRCADGDAEREAELQRLVKDRVPLRQLQQHVAGLDGRCQELAGSLEQLRAQLEVRFERLAVATVGASGALAAQLLDGSPGSAASTDRFRLASPGSSCSGRGDSAASVSLEQRLRHLERSFGEPPAGVPTAGAASPSRRGAAADAAPPAGLRARVSYVESILGDSADRHAQRQAAAVAARSSPLVARTKVRETDHTTVRERLDYVEGIMGDSLEKSKRDLAAAHVKIDLFAVRVTNCESSKDAVHALQRAHDELTQEHSERHASIMQRVDYLEKLIGDSADKHAKELAKHKADAAANHANILHDCRQWMDMIGRTIDDTMQKHSKEIKKVQVAHAQLSGAVEEHGSRTRKLHTSHASIGERVEEIERKIDQLVADKQKDVHKSFFS